MPHKPRKKVRTHVARRVGQGRYKDRHISIREDRLEKLDTTKFEVAIWLMAKSRVEAKRNTEGDTGHDHAA